VTPVRVVALLLAMLQPLVVVLLLCLLQPLPPRRRVDDRGRDGGLPGPLVERPRARPCQRTRRRRRQRRGRRSRFRCSARRGSNRTVPWLRMRGRYSPRPAHWRRLLFREGVRAQSHERALDRKEDRSADEGNDGHEAVPGRGGTLRLLRGPRAVAERRPRQAWPGWAYDEDVLEVAAVGAALDESATARVEVLLAGRTSGAGFCDPKAARQLAPPLRESRCRDQE
jgi:hypothetical protein